MKILAVDSCTNVATTALLDNDKLVAEFVLNDKKTHSVKLLPLIEYMLESVDITFDDIDYYAVTVGPGSFTGQRIGVATVKGLAFNKEKCCIPISALEAMAYNLPFYDGIISPIMDARRGQVYNALFKWENGTLKRLCNDRAIALEDLLNELNGKKTIFLGDGVPVHKESLKNFDIAPSHLLHLRGASVAECGKNNLHLAVSDIDLLPTYLRKSQAEREYEENDRNR